MHSKRLLTSTLLAVFVTSLLTTGLSHAASAPRAVATARSFKACATSARVLTLLAGATCPTGSHRVTV